MKRTSRRPSLRPTDRLLWVLLSRLLPNWREMLVIVKPETVIGWHRKGFRLYWTWKSRRCRGGRPPISRDGAQPGGMTPKNRATLRTFEDDRNRWLLLSLPEILWKEARSGKGSPDRMAVRAQFAIGLEILIVAPLRSHNLYNLRFGATLLKPGGDRGNWHVVLDEDQTKMTEPLEYELPEHLTRMIDVYREELRPVLIKGDRDDGYLFPSRDGGCKRQETLAQQLTHIVRKRTGLRLTPHQHRHLAAQSLLDEEPGNYIGVSHLLGHRNPKSSRMYTGLRTKAAGRHHERLVSEQRRRLSEKAGHRRRSPKKKSQSKTGRDKP